MNAADQRQQWRRLALLAVLACTGDRGLSRDQLMLLFWPDSTQKKARHSLDQLLYAIRSSVHDELFRGVNPIRLNPQVIASDVGDFSQSLQSGDLATAVAAYHGPLLDGFYPSDTREFEDWLSRERERLANRYCEALEKLSQGAEREGNHDAAVAWRRLLAEADPLSSRHAAALILALDASGDRAAAILSGEHYLRVAAREIGAENLTVVGDLLRELRASAPQPVLPPRHGPGFSKAPNLSPASTTFVRYRALALGAGIAVIAVVMALVKARTETNAMPSREQRIGTSNVAAYDLYQRANDPVLLRSDSTALLALGYLQQAVRLDSTFAAAYAGIGSMYQRVAMSNSPAFPLDELERRALAAARKAIALDDSLAEGHSTLGLVESFWATNLENAEGELEYALRLDPTLPRTREYLAMALIQLGRPEDALTAARLAERMHPLSPTAKATTAQVLYVLNRCGEAMPALDSLVALTPPLLRVPPVRSLCYGQLEKWQVAVDAIRPQAERGEMRAMGVFGFALGRMGSRDDAENIRGKLREIARHNGGAGFYVAMVSVALGDSADAATSMRIGLEATGIPYELYGPEFKELREAALADISALRKRQSLVSTR